MRLGLETNYLHFMENVIISKFCSVIVILMCCGIASAWLSNDVREILTQSIFKEEEKNHLYIFMLSLSMQFIWGSLYI